MSQRATSLYYLNSFFVSKKDRWVGARGQRTLINLFFYVIKVHCSRAVVFQVNVIFVSSALQSGDEQCCTFNFFVC